MLHALAAEETIVRRHTKPRPHSLSLDMHAYLNGTVRQAVRQAAFNLSTAVAKGRAEKGRERGRVEMGRGERK